VSLAAFRVTEDVDALVHKYASRDDSASKEGFVSGAEDINVFEGSSAVAVKSGRGGIVPGGVVARGAHGRDDPVNLGEPDYS
jgi:hypothetical protein